MKSNDNIEQQCRHWVDTMVVGLNLCPFAKRAIDCQGVRYRIFDGPLDHLADAFIAELQLLDAEPRIETTLLVISQGLDDFMDYLDILDGANAMLDELGYAGTYQIASFHPHYQFEGTLPEDPSNYTNRAPYPILHLLREESMEKAIDAYGRERAEQIPDNNIERLESLDIDSIRQLLGRF